MSVNKEKKSMPSNRRRSKRSHSKKSQRKISKNGQRKRRYQSAKANGRGTRRYRSDDGEQFETKKCVGPAFSANFSKDQKLVVLLGDIHNRVGHKDDAVGQRVDAFFEEQLNNRSAALVLEDSPRAQNYAIVVANYLDTMKKKARESRTLWNVKNVDVRLVHLRRGFNIQQFSYALGMKPDENKFKKQTLNAETLESLKEYLLNPKRWKTNDESINGYYGKYLKLADVADFAQRDDVATFWKNGIEKVAKELQDEIQNPTPLRTESGKLLKDYIPELTANLEKAKIRLEELQVLDTVEDIRNINVVKENIELYENAIKGMQDDLVNQQNQLFEDAVEDYNSSVVDLHALYSVFFLLEQSNDIVDTIVVYMGAAHTARLAAFIETKKEFEKISNSHSDKLAETSNIKHVEYPEENASYVLIHQPHRAAGR